MFWKPVGEKKIGIQCLWEFRIDQYPYAKIRLKCLMPVSETALTSPEQEVQNWYAQQQFAGFLVRDILSYKVTGWWSNPVPGSIQPVESRKYGRNHHTECGIEWSKTAKERTIPGISLRRISRKKSSFPAGSSYDVGFVFNAEPARMSIVTHISRNLPSNLIYAFNRIQWNQKHPTVGRYCQHSLFWQHGREKWIHCG